jgi:hypothetical protein
MATPQGEAAVPRAWARARGRGPSRIKREGAARPRAIYALRGGRGSERCLERCLALVMPDPQRPSHHKGVRLRAGPLCLRAGPRARGRGPGQIKREGAARPRATYALRGGG